MLQLRYANSGNRVEACKRIALSLRQNMMSYRNCPNCFSQSVSVKDLLFADAHCQACGSIVKIHPVARVLWWPIIAAATVVTTFLVGRAFGFYAAVLWLSFPIGSLCHLRATFSPLSCRYEMSWSDVRTASPPK